MNYWSRQRNLIKLTPGFNWIYTNKRIR
jgi:hypothetical protein